MLQSSLVHSFGQSSSLPLARWPGLAPDAAQVCLDVLSDLAEYGVVAPLAEIAPGLLLWWHGHPEPVQTLFVPSCVLSPVSEHEGQTVVHWKLASESSDKWRYKVSAAARWMAAYRNIPFVNSALLTVAAMMESLPTGDIHLSLPPVNKATFAWPWKRATWEAIRHRGVMLRERRRLAMGLPARVDSHSLEQHIQRNFVAPAAQLALEATNRDKRRRIHVHAAGDGANIPVAAKPLELTVGQYLCDDPLGENIYLLCAGRIRAPAPMAEHLCASGRGLVVLARRIQEAAPAADARTSAWGEPMLATLQLDYLHTHRPAWPLHGAPQ